MNKWSGNLAYGVGLIATDGNLSKDGRHIEFTSKDKEQVVNFLKCFDRQNKISIKLSGLGKKAFRTQIGDVALYGFLLNIGIMPNKTKFIARLKIPRKYFFDFLRGHFDGDGTFYSYYDPRWPNSFMFYTTFTSASRPHILWLQKQLQIILNVKGHITKAKRSSCFQLKYAKAESLKVLKQLYKNSSLMLRRKHLKINRALGIIGKQL